MKIRTATIAEIVRRGDSATLFEIVKSVVASLNARTKELKLERENTARLRHAYAETQSDRDRILRIALDLQELCAENGFGDKAANIINKRGGLSGHGEGEVGEMVIELD